MKDIDYGFKTAIRHRIVLEQKELCHAQTQFYYQFSPLPHYNVGLNSNGKQTTLHGVGGGGDVNL